jgi:hypothetical protein
LIYLIFGVLTPLSATFICRKGGHIFAQFLVLIFLHINWFYICLLTPLQEGVPVVE